MNQNVTIPLVSRHVKLRPPSGHFLEELYRLAATGEISWQWNGASETPESFHAGLVERALVVFSIEERRTGREIGLLVSYGANLFHGFAYASMYIVPDYQKKVWPHEALVLFGNYLFRRFSLRNLYAESVASDYEQFRSGQGRFFDVEGHFRERILVNGNPEDLYVLRMSRSKWEDVGLPLLELCTRGMQG